VFVGETGSVDVMTPTWVVVSEALFFVASVFVGVAVTNVFVAVTGLMVEGVNVLVLVRLGVKVKVAVFVTVLVKVGVSEEISEGVSVGMLVFVAVAERARACAVLTTIVDIWFTSNVGIGMGVAIAGIKHAVETIKINEQTDNIRLMEPLPV